MIAQKYKLPSEIITRVSLCGMTTYLLLATMPSMNSAFKLSLFGLLIGLILVEFFLVIFKRWRLLKVTKITLIYISTIVFILLMIYYSTKFVALTDSQGIENVLRTHEAYAKLIYMLICFAQPIILPIPEVVTIGAGSAVFGPFSAAVLGFLGTISGIIAMFFLARYGGQKLVAKLVKEKHLSKYRSYVGKNETVILVILFIIPILPDEIICVGAGIGAVTFKKFFIIASIAKFITSSLLAYSVYLAQLLPLTGPQLVFGCSVAFAVLFLASIFIKRKLTKRKTIEA